MIQISQLMINVSLIKSISFWALIGLFSVINIIEVKASPNQWQCISSSSVEDWKCSLGDDKPYNLSLEEVSNKQKESYGNLELAYNDDSRAINDTEIDNFDSNGIINELELFDKPDNKKQISQIQFEDEKASSEIDWVEKFLNDDILDDLPVSSMKENQLVEKDDFFEYDENNSILFSDWIKQNNSLQTSNKEEIAKKTIKKDKSLTDINSVIQSVLPNKQLISNENESSKRPDANQKTELKFTENEDAVDLANKTIDDHMNFSDQLKAKEMQLLAEDKSFNISEQLEVDTKAHEQKILSNQRGFEIPKEELTGIRGIFLKYQSEADHENDFNWQPPSSSGKVYKTQISSSNNNPARGGMQESLASSELPILEVTPEERLAKNRRQGYRSYFDPIRKNERPETRKRKKSTEKILRKHHPLAFAPVQMVDPNTVQVPQRDLLENAIGVDYMDNSANSLTLEELAVNPIPTVKKPNYHANRKLGPEIPSYSRQMSWLEIESTKKSKLDEVNKKKKANAIWVQKPPPVTPRKLLISNDYEAPEKTKKTEKDAKNSDADLNDQPMNSSDRFKNYTDKESHQFSFNNAERHNDFSSLPLSQEKDKTRFTMDDSTAVKRVATDIRKPSYVKASSTVIRVDQLNYGNRVPIVNAEKNYDKLQQTPESHFIVQWGLSQTPHNLFQLQNNYRFLRDTIVVGLKQGRLTLYALFGETFANQLLVKQYLKQADAKLVSQLNPLINTVSVVKQAELILPEVNDKSDYLKTSYTKPSRSKLPQGDYTIQWLETSTIEEIQRLQDRHEFLNLAETRVIKRGNQTKYILIQGRFNSKLGAMDELESMEGHPIFRSLVPKIRPMGSLRKSHPVKVMAVKEAYQPVAGYDNSENYYTIQWVAARNPEIIEQLRRRYLELNDSVIVPVKKNGREWYALIQGKYKYKAEAKRVLSSNLFNSITKKLNPGIMPLANLQSSVKL